jgi:hypothetical protein
MSIGDNNGKLREEFTMAICYIYYKNNPQKITVYFWEPNKKSIINYLHPYKGNEDVFSNENMCIHFPKQKMIINHKGHQFEAPLRNPSKDWKNLKHEARFDFNQGNWDDWVEAF